MQLDPRKFTNIQILKISACAFAGVACLGYGVYAMKHNWWPALTFKRAMMYNAATAEREKSIAKMLSRPQEIENRYIEKMTAAATTQIIDPARVSPGYTLICMGIDAAALVDIDGTVRHTWYMPFDKVWPTAPHLDHTPLPNMMSFFFNGHAYPNGDLLAIYHVRGDTPYAYGLIKINSDSELIWSLPLNIHHSLYVAKNQDIYTLEQGFTSEIPERLSQIKPPVLTDYILRLSPDGKQQDRIPLLEAFMDTPYEELLYGKYSPAAYNKNDMIHTNSVMLLEEDMAKHFPMFKAGQLLISIRNFSALAVVDPQTRKVVWATKGIWHEQHDAQFLDNGHILLFDNKGFSNTPGKPSKDGEEDAETDALSRMLEIDPADNKVTWSFHGLPGMRFFSTIRGSVQRLPNGNYLTLESMPGRKLLEVTPDHQIVWRYNSNVPYGNNIYPSMWTALRYAPDYFEPEVLEMSESARKVKPIPRAEARSKSVIETPVDDEDTIEEPAEKTDDNAEDHEEDM